MIPKREDNFNDKVNEVTRTNPTFITLWDANKRLSQNDRGMLGINTSNGALEVWDGTKFIVFMPTGTR